VVHSGLVKVVANRVKHGEVFKFETGITLRSPELELNDIGFLLTANEINHFTWAGVQWQRPFSIFRNGPVELQPLVKMGF
jgi:hypothetical protein